MEYLSHVLGIKVYYKDTRLIKIPNYIYSRYELKTVTLDGKDAVFVSPKTELESVNNVKKHLEKISQLSGATSILVLKTLTYRYKEYLLRDHIPFIVDGKQIYLPFMAVYLQERCDSENNPSEELLPSAQLLLLHYIYNGCTEMATSKAALALGLTATSISRASKQLTELGLIKSVSKGVQKVLISDKAPKELFNFSKKALKNPIKRTIYVPKSAIKEELLISGYSALSEYTMLNPSPIAYHAASSIALYEKSATLTLNSSIDQCAIELWRYDPKKLSDSQCVDRLSLALALREDQDERIEESVEEMLKQVWRDIDGKRN